VRLRRVYVDAPLAAGTRVTLEGSAAHHVTRVLRLRVGEALTLFNGQGGEYAAGIDRAHQGTVTVSVGAFSDEERESPLKVTLAQGISRGERMDFVVQKATELGVARIVPLLTERSVVKLDAHQADRKWNHWRAIAIAACEQSARNRLPEVRPPATLSAFLKDKAQASAHSARLLLSPAGEKRMADIDAPREVTVLIGPEGGLAHEEQDAAIEAGYIPVRMGPRVLRTETAALAALALLQREFGDF
jgi:16S rRNA (uracil1498-N3)-methyltransferase